MHDLITIIVQQFSGSWRWCRVLTVESCKIVLLAALPIHLFRHLL